ncbi:MAG: hypothetical protein IJP98_00540 [Clostridia bacterium]|nr:hypothetical protein [Clostridia bacterium]
MRDVWNNLLAWFRKLGDEDVRLFGRTLKRRVLLLFAAAIVALAVMVPIVITLSNREVSLKYERTDIDPQADYRVHDGIVFYHAGDAYVSINPNESTAVEQLPLLVDADGYDMTSTSRLLYAGNTAQIYGQQPFVLNESDTILAGRAGNRYAALLFRNPYGDMRIQLVDATVRSQSSDTLATSNDIATIPIAGGEVTAFGFLKASDKQELLWVATVDVNQFSEESIVRVYNCDDKGALMFYSASFYNQTIEDVLLTKHCLYLVGTQDLVRYDRTDNGFSSERARVNIYGSRITDCVESGDGSSAYFVVMPLTAEGQPQRLFRLLTVSQSDEDWATVLQQFMSSPIVSVFLQDNRVCVVTTDTFEQFTYAGKSQLEIELEHTPTDVVACDASFLLFTDTVVYRVTVS